VYDNISILFLLSDHDFLFCFLPKFQTCFLRCFCFLSFITFFVITFDNFRTDETIKGIIIRSSYYNEKISSSLNSVAIFLYCINRLRIYFTFLLLLLRSSFFSKVYGLLGISFVIQFVSSSILASTNLPLLLDSTEHSIYC
jgi:hypothetical protein